MGHLVFGNHGVDRSTTLTLACEPCGRKSEMLTASQTHELLSTGFLRDVRAYDSLASTNDEARRLSQHEPIQGPALVICRNQTAGRGRGGNTWISGDGALTFSVLITAQQLGLEVRELSRLSLWTALAVRASLAQCLASETHGSADAMSVKWPNDVCFNGRKISGILLESIASLRRHVIVGIGINVNNQAIRQLTTSRRDTCPVALCEAIGQPCNVFDVLSHSIRYLDQYWAIMCRDPESLSDRWRAHCRLEGKHVLLQWGSGTVEGLCRGVDRDGAMLIESAGRVRPVYAGHVLEPLAP